MSCFSVEYGYEQLRKAEMLPPDFLMVRQAKSRTAIEGCKRISIEYSDEVPSIKPKEALKVWVDWKVAQRQLQIKAARATSVDLSSGGELLQAIAKAQEAAKEYQGKIVKQGISIVRRWEVIC